MLGFGLEGKRESAVGLKQYALKNDPQGRLAGVAGNDFSVNGRSVIEALEDRVDVNGPRALLRVQAEVDKAPNAEGMARGLQLAQTNADLSFRFAREAESLSLAVQPLGDLPALGTPLSPSASQRLEQLSMTESKDRLASVSQGPVPARLRTLPWHCRRTSRAS